MSRFLIQLDFRALIKDKVLSKHSVWKLFTRNIGKHEQRVLMSRCIFPIDRQTLQATTSPVSLHNPSTSTEECKLERADPPLTPLPSHTHSPSESHTHAPSHSLSPPTALKQEHPDPSTCVYVHVR